MHPYWVDEYREFDLELDPRSTLLYEETELNVGLTQTLMSITLLGETECLCTCTKTTASMQGWEGMPQYEHVKTLSKGALNGPNSLYHLSLITGLRQVN